MFSAEECDGVTIVIDNKEDVDPKKQERTVSMAGTVAGCMAGTAAILSKINSLIDDLIQRSMILYFIFHVIVLLITERLNAQEPGYQYFIKGTRAPHQRND